MTKPFKEIKDELLKDPEFHKEYEKLKPYPLKQYTELLGTLTYHAVLYYHLDNPEIEDYEYDRLIKRAEELERELGFALGTCPTKYAGTPKIMHPDD